MSDKNKREIAIDFIVDNYKIGDVIPNNKDLSKLAGVGLSSIQGAIITLECSGGVERDKHHQAIVITDFSEGWFGKEK